MKRLLVILGLTTLATLLLAGPAIAQNLGTSVLALDGVNDYATATDAPFDLGTGASDAFTLETWFYVPYQADEEKTVSLFSKEGSYAVDLFFNRVVDPGGPNEQLQEGIDFTTWFASGGSYTLTVYFPLDDGTWHHLAAVFNDGLFIYVDGQMMQGYGPLTTPLANTSAPFSVGGYPGSTCFPGWLEETRISNIARYSGPLYGVPAVPFVADAQTVALWHFDEAAGATTFADASAHGNDLAGLNGAATAPAPPAPVTTATQDPPPNAAGWTRLPHVGTDIVMVALSAHDPASRQCQRYYCIGESMGLAWSWLDPIQTGVIFTTSGITNLWYFTYAVNGNGEFPKKLTLRIDGTKPVTKALADSTVYRGHRAVLKLRVNDTVSPKAKVTVKIFRRGVLKKTLKLGLRTTNLTIRYTGYTCGLPRGTYVWKVYATDLAGNPQRLPLGYKTLVVR
jgi:hypothetical protein